MVGMKEEHHNPSITIDTTITFHHWENFMAKPTDYDLLVSINNTLNTLVQKGVTVDLSPVLSAITGVQNTANAILADSEPTPEQAPTVTAISPASGSINGGDTVTITGTNFTGATGVLFGTVAGTNLAVTSDTSLTIVSPAQPAGAVDITVVDAAGTSPVSPADQFTYA